MFGESNCVIRVLLIDDSVALRSAWAKLFERNPDFKLVASIGSEAEIAASVRETQPDVIMLDLSVTDGHSVDAVSSMGVDAPHARILIYSGRNPREVLPRIRVPGVAGFVGKNEEPAHVLDAIRRVAQGHTVFPDGIVPPTSNAPLKPGYTPSARSS